MNAPAESALQLRTKLIGPHCEPFAALTVDMDAHLMRHFHVPSVDFREEPSAKACGSSEAFAVGMPKIPIAPNLNRELGD
jgi:hypothetical protein